MAEKSRIKFNPVTKEIEIEGTERFVKTYFGKVQKLLADLSAESVKERKQRSKRGKTVDKTTVAGKAARAKQKKKDGKGNRGYIFEKVIKFITESKGINTAELVKKTGLHEQQVRSVVYRAEKLGRIRKASRGIYTAA
jgi:hypothetical protein